MYGIMGHKFRNEKRDSVLIPFKGRQLSVLHLTAKCLVACFTFDSSSALELEEIVLELVICLFVSQVTCSL